MLTASAFHKPADLEARRKELQHTLSDDPIAPRPKYSSAEMQAAMQRLVTAVLTTGKLPPKLPS